MNQVEFCQEECCFGFIEVKDYHDILGEIVYCKPITNLREYLLKPTVRH